MAKKESALRCVVTLAIIAVVCGVLLSVLSALLYVEPTADDLNSEFFPGYRWAKEEGEQKDYSGATVTLAAKGENGEKPTYIGLLVVTDSDGKLGNSTYAIYINGETDTIEKAVFIKEGATGGFTWDYATSQAKAAQGGVTTGATALAELAAAKGDESAFAEWKNFEDFYIKIDSASVFDDWGVPVKTGATKTVTATFNAFKAAVKYYYENYVSGREQ